MHAKDEGLSNILLKIIFPYSAVLFGYLTGEQSEDHHVDPLLFWTNPFYYLCAFVFFIPYIDIGSPLIEPPTYTDLARTLVFVGVFAALSAIVSVLTRKELPYPALAIGVTELDSRFLAESHWNIAVSNEGDRLSRGAVASLVVASAAVFTAAPLTILIAVIVVASTLSSLVYTIFSPPDIFQSINDESPWGRLIGTYLSYLVLFGPLLLTSYVLIRPVIVVVRFAKRIIGKLESFKTSGKHAIFLRRFELDRKLQPWKRGIGYAILSALPGLKNTADRAAQTNLEAGAINALSGVAEFLAIGKPGEWLPPTGSRRFYVEDSEWKVKVQQLMTSSDIILIVVDFSEVMIWELDQALSENRRTRTILILPEPNRSEEWYKSLASYNDKRNLLPSVSDQTVIVLFPNGASSMTVEVQGSWGFWGAAVAAALSEGMKRKENQVRTKIVFGPKIRGTSILGTGNGYRSVYLFDCIRCSTRRY